MKVMLKFDETDELFVGDDILSEFELCTNCGLCCSFFQDLPIYKEEIKMAASFLQINQDLFKKMYMKTNSDRFTFSLKTPCPFLNQKKCMIYKHRFLVCRTFPLFMNLTTNKAILSGIYFCPQATQFYEGLIEFFKQHDSKLYYLFMEKEKNIEIEKDGMKIQCKASLLYPYLDLLYSTKKDML